MQRVQRVSDVVDGVGVMESADSGMWPTQHHRAQKRGLAAPGAAARHILIAAAVVLTLAGCALGARRVPAGEPFHLLPGEQVLVQGTGLTLQLATVGQSWTVNGDEIPFARLTIVSRFQRRSRELAVGETWRVEGAAIHLRAADPFGQHRCAFEVTVVP